MTDLQNYEYINTDLYYNQDDTNFDYDQDDTNLDYDQDDTDLDLPDNENTILDLSAEDSASNVQSSQEDASSTFTMSVSTRLRPIMSRSRNKKNPNSSVWQYFDTKTSSYPGQP
ncbi:4145_t:CDS:2, partial [Ambispora gerdemannii]